MSDIKRISPMLDNFDVGGSISEHNGVSCYPAMEKNSDNRYIVKAVSIPASQKQLDALLLTGAFPDAAAALSYFKDQADCTVEELEILKRLSELEGFLPYENWQACAKEDGIGFDVYMIGTYKQTLRKYCKKQPMTHLSAINLGLDICTALAVARRSGYLYVDLKPNNIYVVDEHQFRIGDLGFLPMSSLAYASLPDRYRSEFTAPEVQDAFSTLNATLDVYALGMILYQIYNGGEMPQITEGEDLPSPVNADYEMAEILLKACDPDPEKRWQDPIAFGQALVSYMQRNGANNTPIVSPDLSDVEIAPIDDDLDLSDIDLNDIPEVDEAVLLDTDMQAAAEPHIADSLPTEDAILEPVEEDAAAAIADSPEPIAPELTEDPQIEYEEDVEGNLSFMEIPVTDETAPENNLTDVTYDEISDELSQILAQADELVAHPVPDPVVAPEAVEIPALEAEVENLSEDSPADDELLSEEIPDSAEADMAQTAVIPADTSDEISDAEPPVDVEAAEEDKEEEPPIKKKRSPLRWILNIVITLLLLAIVTVGLFYYRHIYLVPINSIAISGDASTIIVSLSSDIDESLLRVICSDSHGSQITAPVVNGTATFSNLAPDTAYNIRVLVDGFHRLTGETAVSHSTPAQTNIVQFTAVTGKEDGSVILSFSLEGPDSGNWSLAYSAPDEEEKTVELLSNITTLTGLTIGKEYKFTLIPGDDMYVTGQTELSFVASELIYAENVNIVSCENNNLTVNWTNPEAGAITEWTVHCYDDASYNEAITTPNESWTFENIDPSKNYTVTVTASGMSVSAPPAYMAANAVTISNFTVEQSKTKMELSWSANQEVPDDGWVLLYTVESTNFQSSIVCDDNHAVISPVVPNATYYFTLQKANGDAVLTAPLEYTTSKAQDFSGYGMIRSSMTYKLCSRPEDPDWDHSDISDSDYTKTFKVGEPISMVGRLHDTYGISEDNIVTLYVFRNADKVVTTYCYQEEPWNDMWYKYYGEFDIPQAPTEPGEYTLSIYFNGKLVTNKTLTIEE